MAMERHQTKWVAEFLVAAELIRQGYDVSLTLGSSWPLADLVVISPQGTTFLVDVKGKCKKGHWLVRTKPEKPNLYYVLVRLAADVDRRRGVADRFYVMSQATQIAATRSGASSKAPTGFPTESIAGSLDAWDILPP